MTITDKTRKLLWGRSGNRCAICRRELAVDATPYDEESIVGDECHIVSGKPNGPRYDPFVPTEKIDIYENLILLCKVDHKTIDDQYASYSVDKLLDIKAKHEEWVHGNLKEDTTTPSIKVTRRGVPAPQFLHRITSGKTLFSLLHDTSGASFDNDEPKSVEEMELIGDFFQNMRDLVDIVTELEPSAAIREGFLLNKSIEELESAGFFLFGIKETLWTETGRGKPFKTPVLRLLILRNTNPAIIKVDMDRIQQEMKVPSPGSPKQSDGPNKDQNLTSV